MFIKLTLASGNKIRINTRNIESYGTITEDTHKFCEGYEGMTYIVPAGMLDETTLYIVKESANEIDEMLETCGMMYIRIKKLERGCTVNE